MQNYVEKLYKEFETRIKSILEPDSFYQYFMEAVNSGVRFYGQKNKRIVKRIDNVWVDAMYDAMIPLDEITSKPKKFIEREEVIVPIELARKTGADSVKHLSTHTQFIASVNDGNVVPNKIMNTFNEESYNLYENRFIYCLIQKACEFIDQRYDALINLKGDEFESNLKVESSFTDNDEKVEYDLSLKLHQGADYLGSENKNAEALEKIEYIRRMFNSFKQTEFYNSLVGCRKVKSPISRTNLMMKNRYFKKCYELWNFLEQYREAGYTIEEHEIDGDIEEKHIDELNMMILFNYLIMKNNLADIHNKPIEMSEKEPRVFVPRIEDKVIEEADPDYSFEQTVLEKVSEQKPELSEPKWDNHDDIILAALVKALGDERILNALEKALMAENVLMAERAS